MFKCRICENLIDNTTYETKEMMFGLKDKFEYFQCAQCYCLQIASIPSDMSKYYPSNYYSYSHKEPYIKKSNNSIIAFIRKLRDHYTITNYGAFGRILYLMFPNEYLKSVIDSHFPLRNRRDLLDKTKKILDVGCGTGNFLWILKELGFDNLFGIDPYIEGNIIFPNGLKILKKTIHDLNEEFDLIMFHHSFEHVSDPLETLQSASRLLKKGGICLVRVPIVDSYAWKHYKENWYALESPRHFFLHSIKSIKILADKTGFILKDIIYDSTAFNLWASEQYVRNIPLESELSYAKNKDKSIFTDRDIRAFKKLSIALNKEKRGDQAAFYLKRI